MSTDHSRAALVDYDDGAAAVRPGAGPRGARRAQHRHQDVLRLRHRFGRRAQHAGLPGLPRPARRAAGGQRHGGRVGDPDRARAQLRDRGLVPVRAEELLLPGHAQELPDLAVRRADRLRRLRSTSSSRTAHRHRVEIERAHMEEDTGKSLHVGGATGRIHGADYSLVDYNRAGVPLIEIVTKPIPGPGQRGPRGRQGLRRRAPRPARALGVSDARMEQGSLRCDANLSLRRRTAARTRTARHPHRDQERQLAALGRARRPLRDQRHAAVLAGGGTIMQETRHLHEDTGITTSGRPKSDAEDYRYFPEPDLVPVAPDPAWVEELRAHAARAAAAAPPRACRRTGASPTSRCATSSTPVRVELDRGDRRRRRRPRPAPASGGRARSPAAPTTQARDLADLAVTPAHVAELDALVDRRARSTTSSPARCSRACSPARAPRTRSSQRAGWRSSRDDGALAEAVDDGARRAARRRSRRSATARSQAAGALVGAVMKATRGQADAARVRELLLEQLGA